MIAGTAAKVEDLTLNITEEIHVKAPLEVTFELCSNSSAL